MKKNSILGRALLLALLLSACAKQMEEDIPGKDGPKDGSISFSAQSDYSYMWHQGMFSKEGLTKTEYSGEYNAALSSALVYERINWKSGDAITISQTTKTAGASSYASLVTDASHYDITPGSINSGSKTHAASVSPSKGQTKLRWRDGNYDYFFQGIYPAYTSTWISTLKTEAAKFKTNSWLIDNSASGDSNRSTWSSYADATANHNKEIAFVIPHNQNGTQTTENSVTKVSADMRFATMAAVTEVQKADVSSSAQVSLAFRPLFNAYEFRIAPVNDEASLSGKKLLRARLYVDGSNSFGLTGMWLENVNLPQSGATLVQPVEDPSLSGGNTAYAGSNSFAYDNRAQLCSREAVLTLSNVTFDHEVRLTFLSLPLELSGLWLELSFEGNIIRKFPLKMADGSFISVSPGHKLLVSNLEVPGWEYVLTAPESVYLEANAGNGRLNGTNLYPFIQSYKKSLVNASVWAPVEIEYVEFLDKDENVCSTEPYWLNGYYTRTSNPETSGSASYVPIEDGWFDNSGRIDNSAHPIIFNYKPGSENTKNYTFYLDWAAVDAEWGIMDDSEITKIPGYNQAGIGSSSNPHNLYSNTVPGTGIGANESANCYVVSQPGWYMFPLVYGNSWKDGSANTSSYWPAGVSVQSEAPFLTRFRNAAGNEITSPWIMNDITGVSEWKPIILWQDSFPNYYIVDEANLEIIDGVGGKWLKFQIKPYDSATSTGFRPGNVVIALAAKVGASDYRIAWNWHIWISGGSLSPVSVPQKSGRVNQFMPLNLGWTPSFSYGTKPLFDYIRVTQADSKKTASTKLIRLKENQYFDSQLTSHMEGYSNTFYQWGRKDPFLPQSGRVASGASWNSSLQRMEGGTGPGSRVVMNTRRNYYSTAAPANHPWPIFQDNAGSYTVNLPKGPMDDKHKSQSDNSSYNASGQASPQPLTEADYNRMLARMILNPTEIFYDNSGKNVIYYYPEYVNLWNARQNSYSPSMDVLKTIYDPSPSGFCVPHYDAFSNFTLSGNPVVYSVDSSGYSKVSGDYTGTEIAYPGQDNTGGRTFPGGLYLPASGKRAYVDGSPQAHSKVGYYWSSTPNRNVNNSDSRKSVSARRFMFVISGQENWMDEVNQGYDNRTRVVSVRPMVIPQIGANDQDYNTDGQVVVDGGGGVWDN